MHLNTIDVEEFIEVGVVKFSSVITLKSFYGGVELCLDIRVKMKKFGEYFAFATKWIDPEKMSVMIKKENIVAKTADA